MPLTFADIGEAAIIKRISGNPDLRRHLNEMGFVPGGTVMVISKIGGNVIVNVKESRVAISKEMANKIFI